MKLIYHLLILLFLNNVLADKHRYQSEWAIKFNDSQGPYSLDSDEFENLGPIGNLRDWYLIRHKPTHARNMRIRSLPATEDTEITNTILSNPHVYVVEQQKAEPLANQVISIKDPLYSEQWHLENTGQSGATPGVDINVKPAWQLGYTGVGVRIAIVDDGIQFTHPDLAPGYQAASSLDVNDNDYDPSPDLSEDYHGTSVAGVAVASNNSECGVGSAFQAEISGIRLTAKSSSDADRARALSYMHNENDIFSGSFAPVGTEYTVGRRGTLTIQAMKDSVANGRNGKGSIYVFAAGNGAREGSNCNYNSFANARETIAVGAIGFDGVKTPYSEMCSALLVVAPSGNSVTAAAGIRTTDLLGSSGYDASSCTSTFSGTSASCPLVSGVIALMLQANADLTWRDVQNILATTSYKTDPTDSDWRVNGAGHLINHKYGFGRVDATAAVQKALSRTFLGNATEEFRATSINRQIPDFPNAGLQAQVTVQGSFVLETVVVTVYIVHNRSGDLQIELISPSGTRSTLSESHGLLDTIVVENGPTYTVGGSAFGQQLALSATSFSSLVLASSNACTAPPNCNAMKGNIGVVLASSTSCTIYTQVLNLQICEAVGAIVIGESSTVTNIPLPNNADTALVFIPNVQLTSTDGQTFLANINSKVAFKKGKYAANDYQGWQFSTVRNWGENSAGVWSISVTDGLLEDSGIWQTVSVNFYGSSGEYTDFVNRPPSPSSNPNPNPTSDPDPPPPFPISSSATSGESTTLESVESDDPFATSNSSSLYISFITIIASALFVLLF